MSVQVTAAVQELKPYVAGPRLEDVCRAHGVTEMALLHANECPDGPFPEVMRAIVDALPGLNRYPDQDCRNLRAGLSAQLGVDPACLMFGNGSCELLKLLSEAYVSPGDHLLFPHPSFVVYSLLGVQRQARVGAIPLLEHGVDLEAMAAAVSDDTRMVIVCNPNNPTGTYHSPERLRRFISAIPAATLVVLDEAYVEYVTAADHLDTSSWVGEGWGWVV